jgi:quercetin dioxygenase-like cupin family protein
MLDPGEVFEHTHLHDSITTLLEGKVDIVIGVDRSSLVPDEPTRVPGGIAHWLINVGQQVAVTKCIHAVGELPAER